MEMEIDIDIEEYFGLENDLLPEISSECLDDLEFADNYHRTVLSPWKEMRKAGRSAPKLTISLQPEREATPPLSVSSSLPVSPEFPFPTVLWRKGEHVDKLPAKEYIAKKVAVPKKTYPKVKLEGIKKKDVDDFRNGKLDFVTSHSLMGHREAFVDKSGSFKLDFRALIEKLPPIYQYEVMNSLPKSYTQLNGGRMELKPGIFGMKDEKFKRRLLEFQSRLRSGEYDTDVRRIYIEMSADKLDPWKAENFEPIYGDLCGTSRKEETPLLSASSSSSFTFDFAPSSSSPPTPVSMDSTTTGRSEKENANTILSSTKEDMNRSVVMGLQEVVISSDGQYVHHDAGWHGLELSS